MNRKSETWNLLKPVVVLTVICVVVSLALALTNSVTKPIIDAANEKAALETRMQLLPEATSFTECEVDIPNVQSVFQDDGGTGYVITTIGKGYRGDITVVVGLDATGSVIGIHADASGETPDVGTRAGEAAFTDQFIGLSSPDEATAVDVVSGATYSSHAVANAVSLAFEAYQAVKEG